MSNQDFGTGGGAPHTTPQPTGTGAERRGGVGLGVLLIAIGAAFLAAQFVPGVSWWQLWPLIVILVGAIQLVTPDPRDGWGLERVMDGIGTVIVGGVLLSNTTGFVSWDVWWTLLMLWPVLLVAIGLRVIGRGTGQSWVKALGPVVIWLAFAYAVSVSLTGVGGVQPYVAGSSKPFALFEPVDQVTEAKLRLESGVGEINIGGNAGQLITASGVSPFGTPNLRVKRSGNFADVDLGMESGGGPFLGAGLASGKLTVDLSPQVVWDAELQTGASTLDADFSDLKVRALTVKSGASSVDVKLGAVPEEVNRTDVAIKSGVSSVKVVLPRDAEARVTSSSGLSATDVTGGFQQEADGVWRTPGYGSSGKVYEIVIESGVGSVSVERN
jgi:hypothetical protein